MKQEFASNVDSKEIQIRSNVFKNQETKEKRTRKRKQIVYENKKNQNNSSYEDKSQKLVNDFSFINKKTSITNRLANLSATLAKLNDLRKKCKVSNEKVNDDVVKEEQQQLDSQNKNKKENENELRYEKILKKKKQFSKFTNHESKLMAKIFPETKKKETTPNHSKRLTSSTCLAATFSSDIAVNSRPVKKIKKEKNNFKFNQKQEIQCQEEKQAQQKEEEEEKDSNAPANMDWKLEEFFQNKEKFDQFDVKAEKKQRINIIYEEILLSLSANQFTQVSNLITKANTQINQWSKEKQEEKVVVEEEEETEKTEEKNKESKERDYESQLNSIQPENHFPSLYVVEDYQKREYEKLIKLREKIQFLLPCYRQIIYEEKGLELLSESKSNQLSQINWKNGGNYFCACLSKLDPILFENFMKESQFHHLCKTRIISFYKYTQKNSHRYPLFQKQFEIAIACIKWYNFIQQSVFFSRVQNYLEYVLFDLWFLRLYQGKKLTFIADSPIIKIKIEGKNKKNNKNQKQKQQPPKILHGILRSRDCELFNEICKLKYHRKTPFSANQASRLCIQINNDDEKKDTVDLLLLLENKKFCPPPYEFGISYPFNDDENKGKQRNNNNKEFFHLNVESIPNTQNILNECFKTDVFFEDLRTEGLDKELYIILKEFPCEICLLITQYLRSIFYK